MNNIDLLLDDLNLMIPLSAGFWNDLQPMMTEKHKKTGHLFLKPGQVAKKAWQLVSGFILAIRTHTSGEEIMERIYYPKDIVTDLDSFFEMVPIRYKFVAVGNVTVLEIKRNDVMKLQQYAETGKLIQHVTFLDKKATEEIVQMLRLPEEERVKFFLENYPIAGLPAQYCASFLNLNLENYLGYAEAIEISGELQPKEFNSIEENENDYSNNTAYKIKAYITSNYTNRNIGNTRKIAEQFNMTSVTLNRLFIKTFGFTIHKFVIKCRMLRAQELLKSGNFTIGNIALTIGYKNIFHFSKVFKNHYGYTPKLGKTNK